MKPRCGLGVAFAGVSLVLLIAEVSSETSYQGMRRGTRLNKVDPDTPWTNTTSPNNTSSEGLLAWLSRSAISLLRECGSNASASGNDVSICLKLAAVRAIDKFSRTRREVPLVGGVVLVPEEPSDQYGAAKSLPPADEMPRSLQEKQQWANKQLVSRVLKLIGSISFRLQLPSARSISDFATQGGERLAAVASSVIDTEESINPESGRKSGGGGHSAGMLNAGVIMGSSLLPIKLSMLALLVGKALMLSALAFVVPASRFLQSLASRGGHCH